MKIRFNDWQSYDKHRIFVNLGYYAIIIHACPFSCGAKSINGIDRLIDYCIEHDRQVKDVLDKIIEECKQVQLGLAQEHVEDSGSMMSPEEYLHEMSLDLDVPYYIISTTIKHDKHLDFCTKLTPQTNPNSGNKINIYIYERFKV